jgi:hypothetical protein
VVDALFKTILQHLHEEAAENHEKPHVGQPVSRPTFEHGTSRIRNKGSNYTSATFCITTSSVANDRFEVYTEQEQKQDRPYRPTVSTFSSQLK